MTESSPIFAKTFQLMLWLMRFTEKFPKSERFRLAMRLNDSLFNFHQDLLEAVYCDDKRSALLRADIELAKLRVYDRLCRELELSSMKQYEFFTNQVVEIGRLLGGWEKSLSAKASS
jgi:hypothetical protein